MGKKFTATFVNSLKAVSDNAKRKRMEYLEKVFVDDLPADDHERIERRISDVERRISDVEESIKRLESRVSIFEYKMDDHRRRMRWIISE